LSYTIILWAMAKFPGPAQVDTGQSSEESQTRIDPVEPLTEEQQKAFETDAKAQILRNSFAGRLGRAVEPLIAPLGYDWKIGIGLFSSFAARETFVSTMSILYNVGKDEEATSASLLQAMRDAKRDDGSVVWSPLLAFTTMIFYLLAFQCMSTFATVRRETNTWGWALFMVGYMTGLAYVVTFLVYQGGKLLGF